MITGYFSCKICKIAKFALKYDEIQYIQTIMQLTGEFTIIKSACGGIKK